MNILAVIPHYFSEISEASTNRSHRIGAAIERRKALKATITALFHHFGGYTCGLDHGNGHLVPASPKQKRTLKIIICTVPGCHLLSALGDLGQIISHHEVDINPLLLGFECHRIMRIEDERADYDYICYVEDDIVITDPGFFEKRRYFDLYHPPQALLQPNRYELADLPPVHKLYVDYSLNPVITALQQDISRDPILSLNHLGSPISFERTSYPSAGCFILNRQQMQLWTGSPWFLDGDISYLSALDSAATLSIMKTFRIYKSALPNAHFLEVMHASPRWISGIRKSFSISQE